MAMHIWWKTIQNGENVKNQGGFDNEKNYEQCGCGREWNGFGNGKSISAIYKKIRLVVFLIFVFNNQNVKNRQKKNT